MPPAKPLQQRVMECIARHPEWEDRRVASSCYAPVALVRSARSLGKSLPTTRGPETTAPGKPVSGKTLADFRKQFDVRERIRSGLKLHLSGVYRTDQDFREACGVPPAEWRRFADLEEFEPYRWRYRGVLYWAAPKVLEQMKEIVGVA